MLKINGFEFDFDITSPLDVMRYKEAGEQMEAQANDLTYPAVSPDDPTFLDAYVDMLNRQLRIFANFLDSVFGDGSAQTLLGGNPSLSKVTEISDALSGALENQGKDFGVKLKKYTPNRATRRSKK